MILVPPRMIPEIDRYACDVLGIPTLTLMDRAGGAVADAVRTYVPKGSSVSVFAGKGNNGGDGYAAALKLMSDYTVTVYDVFSAGQRSEEGTHFLYGYTAAGGTVLPLTFDEKQLQDIRSSQCVVDAVFGTGYTGALPDVAIKLADVIMSLDDAVKIAIDVPLGIDSALGTLILPQTYIATATVILGFVKTGLISYPARKYLGNLIYDNIGLQNDSVSKCFTIKDYCVDGELALQLLPKRATDSHKGTFGKLLMITGSSTYQGAAHLTLEAALRSGVGYVTYLGEKELCDSLVLKFPEVIYKPCCVSNLTDSELDALSQSYSAILIGSGLGQYKPDELYRILEQLLKTDGSPIVLDADAINVLAKDTRRSSDLIASSPRKIILTPHPLEFSRLTDIPIQHINGNRLALARTFASEKKCTLVLKGAGTVVCDGQSTYVNSSGSSALAKAGSGDVLAGHLAALVALGIDPTRASALAVYLHGAAADSLAEEMSEFGVTPSDLPTEIARQITKLEKKRK